MPTFASLDFETLVFEDGCKAPWPVVFVVHDAKGGRLYPWHDPASRAYFLELIESDTIIIGHNLAYDLGVGCVGLSEDGLEARGISAVFKRMVEGTCRDTKIRQELLDIAAGRRQEGGHIEVLRGARYERADYKLTGLEKMYLGRDRSEDKGEDAWRKRYEWLYYVPLELWPEDARRYVLEDGQGTYDVFFAQYTKQLGCSATRFEIINEREQVYAAWALHLASCWGMRTDGATVSALKADVVARWAEIQQKMYEEGLFKISGPKAAPKLSKNMAAIKGRVETAFKKLGTQPPTTDKGNVKTDADTLSLSGDPLLEELGEGGPISTVLKTFLPVLERGVDKPINTSYSVLVNSGRVSSWNPNLNNIPRSLGVRECYVPREGFVYSASDFNAAELRAWAQVCYWLFGQSDMRDFFIADSLGDPHLELAAVLIGVSAAEAKARLKAGDKDVKRARQMCKALNFSLPVGVGIAKICEIARRQYGVEMSETEARSRKQQWLGRWREGRLYHKFIGDRTEYGRTTAMCMIPGWKTGAKHRYRGGLGYTDLGNNFFQALVADAAKQGLTWLSYECYTGRTYDTNEPSVLAGSRVVAHIYDENILEVPVALGHECSMRMNTIMKAGAQMWIPDVPIEVEPTLMPKWSKEAKPVYDKSGRLTPWVG